MSTPSIAIVRAPQQYKYDKLHVYEEPIITYLLGYFHAIGFKEYSVIDFHLQRETIFEELINKNYSHYVLAIRETGENPHYVRRLAKGLSKRTNKPILIYGQTARLKRFKDWSTNVHVIPHVERLLAAKLGLDESGPSFGKGLILEPYMHKLSLEAWQIRRARGVVETTRGCHFGCAFCFINQGVNYEKRWTVRENEEILIDLKRYCKLGIRNFVFYDSEFFGKNQDEYSIRRELIKSIRDQLPKLRFKIYARADTLLSFGDIALLKEAGLVQVFLGVESLRDDDLKALKKGLSVNSIIKAINKLKKFDIYCNLSFIVFNRNTDVEGIRTNLDHVSKLLQNKPRLLGIPSFTFSFESDWRGKAGTDSKQLSDRTYVIHDLRQKEQPENQQIFNASLEPLMELFRLLSYEWNKKLTNLNLSRDNEKDSDNISRIEYWFENLAYFCLDIMKQQLDLFDRGEITLDNLPIHKSALFDSISEYYSHLPPKYQKLETADNHAKKLNYSSASERLEDDEYWLEQIPA